MVRGIISWVGKKFKSGSVGKCFVWTCCPIKWHCTVGVQHCSKLVYERKSRSCHSYLLEMYKCKWNVFTGSFDRTACRRFLQCSHSWHGPIWPGFKTFISSVSVSEIIMPQYAPLLLISSYKPRNQGIIMDIILNHPGKLNMFSTITVWSGKVS